MTCPHGVVRQAASRATVCYPKVSPRPRRHAVLQHWEYKIHVLKGRDVVSSAPASIEQVHRELADLGRDGWELHSTQPIEGERGMSALLLIFKRPAAAGEF
jgi:hypothetical protein